LGKKEVETKANIGQPGIGQADNSAAKAPLVYKRNQKSFRPEKLAIASETGENIDACFGRVEQFRIYRLTGSEGNYGYELEEIRPGPHPCQEKTHDLQILDQTAELLSDCEMVLAGRIGPAAIQALSQRGVMGLAASLSVKEALRRLSTK
jgi:predicted Fe-Mo cluster-binding NifX family protein